jgi:hypothetical protein
MTKICGLMLDSARCLENRAYYREAIQFAAQRNVNFLLWHFNDDQGCTLQFDSIPGIACPNAYTKAEMKELIAFARQHGITIIPELASLGHSRYITSLPQFRHLDEVEHVFTGICPVAPETLELLTKLVDETAEVFDSPWFHVGLDEANIGHHPLTRQALVTKTKSELFADHINFMHEQVRRHGRTMMMWGDGLLNDRSVAANISREIIICDWQYGANITGDTAQYFLDEGFSVVLCPALISHGQTLFPGDQLAISNLRTLLKQQTRQGKGKVLGVIETVWQPERFMHDSLWIGLDLALTMMQEGPELPIDGCTSGFVQTFYGFTPSPNWVAACRDAYRLSPLRAEWLGVLTMDAKRLPSPADVAGRARRWRHIADTFAAAEHQVHQHQQAYRTFCLMTELLAHLYRKCEMLRTSAVPYSETRQMLKDERRLVAEVEAVWDRERYADDPNKRTASRECFRENNLLAMLFANLERTEKLFSRPELELSIHLSKPVPVADVVAK